MTRAALSRAETGAHGEDLAVMHLEAHGYSVLARNWRPGPGHGAFRGEIDIVTRHAGGIVFVEVRTRRGDSHGEPEESLTPHKTRTLFSSAQRYLAIHKLHEVTWRIDLIAVALDARDALVRLEHIENALEITQLGAGRPQVRGWRR